MPINAVCSGCQKKYKLAESTAGKTVRCKSCGTSFKIPAIEHENDDFLFAEPIDEAAEADAQENEISSEVVRAPKANRSESKRAKGSNSARAGRPPSKAGSSNLAKWLGVALGGAGVLVLLCGGVGYYLFSLTKPPAASAQAGELFPLDTLKIPAFPELGTSQTIADTDVSVYQVDLGSANAGNSQPAARMQLRVYLPPGEHTAGSLGCVLIGPAGTNLMTGNELDDANYHTETLPYVLAGFVAVAYSLDGSLLAARANQSAAYRDFSAAFAGLANSRAALEFVLARLPQVDAKRIFAAGHSSAGTPALLFAEHEPRLKGCIAFAAEFDVETSLSLIARLSGIGNQFPGLVDFAKRSSPSTHLSQMKCPLFLFWALDDQVVDPTVSQRFAGDMSTFHNKSTVKTVPTGGHFDPMVNTGIPLAIEWMRSLAGERPAAEPETSPDR